MENYLLTNNKSMKLKTILIVAALLLSAGVARAQKEVAVKTNFVHDATGSLNLAVEYAFLPKWSFELPFSYNRWLVLPEKSAQWKHAIFQPAFRYWTCERFNGWFFGIHAILGKTSIGSLYDFSQIHPSLPNLKDFMLYRALVLGGGLSAGYDVALGRHWNLEFELGLGYAYIEGDEYELVYNAATGKRAPRANALPVRKDAKFDYFGPTKASIALVYIF